MIDSDLARVLALMGILKAVLIGVACVLLYWRLCWPFTAALGAVYLAGVVMMAVATVFIWAATKIAIAGVLFHLGLLTLALGCLNDRQSMAPVEQAFSGFGRARR